MYIQEIETKTIKEVDADGSYTDLIIFTADGKPTAEDIQEEFTTRCTHPHDCCGHRYFTARYSTLKQLDKYKYSIERDSYINN